MFQTSANDFIKKIILTDVSEVDELIANELADIRNKFINNDETNFVQNVMKLMYLNMRGYNTSFGQIRIISLVSKQQYSFKRIGYLAAASIIDMTNDLSILITQEIQKDIKSSDDRIKICALQFLANCGDQQIFQNVIHDLIPLFDSINVNVVKSAVMCAVRAIRQNKDFAEEYKPFVPKLLAKGEHTLQIVAVNLANAIYESDSSAVESWKQIVPKVINQLKQLQDGGQFAANSVYSHKRLNDPFLQIKLMSFLTIVGESSTELDDLLTTIVTSGNLGSQSAYAILQAAVECVSSCAQKESLRGLAVNQLGKTLAMKNSSIIYSALASLSKMLFRSSVFDRESPDSIAVQRYRDIIVMLLDHQDNSIRRRALDVICALVNKTNCQEVIPQMIDFLKSVDSDFRAEMVPKILAVTQSFAPDDLWNFDTQLDIILRCDGYIPSASITQFTNLVIKKPTLHKHAVSLLSNALVAYSENQSLCQVGAFIIGELQEDPSVNDIETLTTIAHIPQTSEETMCYVVAALAKLGNRFNQQESVSKLLMEMSKTNSLEIQQRCGEMARILANKDLRNGLLAQLDDDVEETESTKEVEKPTTELVVEKPKEEAPKATITPPKGSVLAFKNNDYVIFFEIAPVPNQPRLMIRVSTFGLGDKPLTKFLIQYGVPIGWSLHAQAPSGNVLEPLGGKPIVQVIMVECKNRTKLLMKAVVSYLYITQPLKDQITMNPVFQKYGL